MWSSQPSQATQESQRREWLVRAHNGVRKEYMSIRLSSHSLLLLLDIELAFRAGAWLSVVVLSQACVEATLRQVVAEDYKRPAAKLFGGDEDLSWLRELRNEILHAREPGTPSSLWKLPSDDVAACQASLEPEAKRAVVLAYKAIYAGTDA